MSVSIESLLRLLRVLPLATRPEGIGYEEAAALCGVSASQIRKDLAVLAARADYLPPGSEDDFQMMLAGDRINIFSPRAFQRPIRLLPDEMLAVSLALRCAGLPTDLHRELCAEVEAALALSGSDKAAGRGRDRGQADVPSGGAAGESGAKPAQVTEPSPTDGPAVEFVLTAADGEGVRSAFSRGVLECRRVRFGYVKAHGEAPEIRHLEPRRIIHAEGESYVLGHDVDRAAPRIFRLDRVLGCQMMDETFEPDDAFDTSRAGPEGGIDLLMGDSDRWAEVRYSPRVARWVRERYAGEEDESGSYRVRHRLFSDEWIVRHVLHYGAEAEVLGPAEVRDRIRAAVGG